MNAGVGAGFGPEVLEVGGEEGARPNDTPACLEAVAGEIEAQEDCPQEDWLTIYQPEGAPQVQCLGARLFGKKRGVEQQSDCLGWAPEEPVRYGNGVGEKRRFLSPERGRCREQTAEQSEDAHTELGGSSRANVLRFSCKARLVVLVLSYSTGRALAAANAG
jgi:hypothetical protein